MPRLDGSGDVSVVPTLSIVVLTYNRRQLLEVCLHSLLGRPRPGRFTIDVVEQKSDELGDSQFLGITSVHSDEEILKRQVRPLEMLL